jgi:hypothetical protein
MIELIKKLSHVQKSLNAPKNNFNGFGKYNYRSCEDILQAVKPLLGEGVILIDDQIELIGERYYVRATATFYFGDNSHSVSAYAREPLTKKGMDDAQITGGTSSYARKYALNGLLLIDDNKDPDTQPAPEPIPHPNSKEAKAAKEEARKNNDLYQVISGYLADESQHPYAIEALEEITSEEEKKAFWCRYKPEE